MRRRLDECCNESFHLHVTTETEILAAVDGMPASKKARLMPKLRRRLEDFYDLQAVKRAQSKGVYHAYEDVRRKLAGRRAAD